MMERSLRRRERDFSTKLRFLCIVVWCGGWREQGDLRENGCCRVGGLIWDDCLCRMRFPEPLAGEKGDREKEIVDRLVDKIHGNGSRRLERKTSSL